MSRLIDASVRARRAFTYSGIVGAALSALAGCSLLQHSDDGSQIEAVENDSSIAGSAPLSLNTGTSGGKSAGGASGQSADGDANATPACESLAGLGECGNTTIAADIRTVNILLVIDKSGSMTDKPAGFEVDKWSALKTALSRALSGVSGDVNLGLLLYPYSTKQEISLVCHGGCCEVPDGSEAINVDVAGGDKSLPTIMNALETTAPGGGTPTAAALERANDYFKTGAGSGLKGNNYVLLATDGGPNCNSGNSCGADTCTTNLDKQCDSGNCCQASPEGCLDDVAVTQQIKALKANGVRTFVVGIPGTESYSNYLNTFADAGGVTSPGGSPSYYAVSAKGGVQGLVDVFTGITTQLVHSCKLPLSSNPPKLDEVNLAVDCQLLRPTADDGSSWVIDKSTDPFSVVLKGPICEQLQSSGAKRVDIVYGCPTVR